MTPTQNEFGDRSNGHPGPLGVLLDLELPVLVRFGSTRMPLGELAKVGPGATIDFEKSSESAVEVLVNDRVVARGEAVVVQGCYGVRITEVLSSLNPGDSNPLL